MDTDGNIFLILSYSSLLSKTTIFRFRIKLAVRYLASLLIRSNPAYIFQYIHNLTVIRIGV